MTHPALVARRTLLKVAAAGAAASCLSPLDSMAQARQIVVADPGGPYTAAYRKAFYEPFERTTGVKIVGVAREAQPLAQFTAMVQTRNYIWDVTTLTIAGDIPILQARGLLEPIGLSHAAVPELMQEAVTENWLGVDVYATCMAYRTDKFRAQAPQNWRDFWDVSRFPGRRALRRSPIDTLEQALMADGVPMDKLYPLDVDRAFRSLDKIKPHIQVWWTSGAQSSQLIQSGEVDLISTWNGRSQTAIDGGAAVRIVWDQGLYSIEGWGIPKGTPRAEMAKAFVRFCADAKRQSEFTDQLAYGPTNLRAYEHIPSKRASILPTAPDNIKRMRLPSPEWWAANRERVTERFQSWLLA